MGRTGVNSWFWALVLFQRRLFDGGATHSRENTHIGDVLLRQGAQATAAPGLG